MRSAGTPPGFVRRARRLLSAALVALAAAAAPALAVQPEERLADPALEERAREISKGLRCVVCQNQSIDDSDAVIAGDMRRLVRERLVAGDSDGEIRDLMVSYYGEFVLLQPRLSFSNIAIWAAAPLALLIGGFWVWRKTRLVDAGAAPVAAAPEAAPLSDAEKQRLAELMGGRGRSGG